MFDTILKVDPADSLNPLPPPSPEIRDPDRARRLFGRVAGSDGEDAIPLPPDPAPDAAEVRDPERARRLFGRVAGAPGEEVALPLPADPAPAPAPAAPVFSAVQRRDLAQRAGRRAAWAVVAAALEVVGAGCVAAAAAALTEPTPPELPMVEVKLAAAFPRAPGPPRAPGLPAAPAPRRPATATPPGPGRPRGVRPPPPTALLQPREVQVAMKPPDPGEPVEDWGDPGAAPANAAAVDEGVIGGVVGGEGGGAWGGGASVAAATAATTAKRADEVEDAPLWATAGFRKPVEETAGCVARSVRLPRELAGFTSGPYVVRFAVLPSGAVERIEVLGDVPDVRIRNAIVQAVHSCRWIAGSDAQGRPVSIWVVLPIRFQSA
ncbi:energy transducer TonB [Anaeromyxobacter oryzae]|uniref:TonB C-terminal domain-containing protein n=1 Tax=Anaeromyxobacter oryzae TaxID=2918170 RepID=A0ABM7WP46_9BACT|nr:energy transducer TonB [Anaeromyxobacter oryzae]BDG01228.1 hypothetical protein AMOR_02240 [Anaeromyxobacter oryzae]